MLRSSTLRCAERTPRSRRPPLALLLASLIASSSAAEDTKPIIDLDVRTQIARGPVRVLVDLEVPRESAIGAAQQAVVARLVGTRFTLGRQYATVPMLALEIDADALEALERMPDLVRRVRADVPRAPTKRDGS